MGDKPNEARPGDQDPRSWRGAYLAVLLWLAVQIAALTLLARMSP